ncbi:recombinase family protein [Streptomyces gulbargensis]|uniref:recombinase family protein n=1 Tax=Streptomyces gulbargensis TaxID=364901 RepID=UPI003CD09EDA
MGAHATCHRLNEQQRPSKRGGKWRPTTVARIIDPAARVRSAFDRAQKEENRRTGRRKSLAPASGSWLLEGRKRPWIPKGVT